MLEPKSRRRRPRRRSAPGEALRRAGYGAEPHRQFEMDCPASGHALTMSSVSPEQSCPPPMPSRDQEALDPDGKRGAGAVVLDFETVYDDNFDFVWRNMGRLG